MRFFVTVSALILPIVVVGILLRLLLFRRTKIKSLKNLGVFKIYIALMIFDVIDNSIYSPSNFNYKYVQVDLTITLLVRDGIIELKDGIWQSYLQQTIANSAHFYFYPRHKNKNTVIYFRSKFNDLKMVYKVWKIGQ